MSKKQLKVDKKKSTKKSKYVEEVRPELFKLNLNKYELIHLRDLFSVGLPPDVKVTVSQSLALQQARQLVETKLWVKISSLCNDAKIAMEDDAPDFVVSAISTPALGVFELAHDPEQNEPEQKLTSMFEKSDVAENED